MDNWHYCGRWAVEGNKLFWDVVESDMPFAFGDDMDDVVVRIDRDEMVTQDVEGKLTTYRRIATSQAEKENPRREKVVNLAVRRGDTSSS